ncbi:MAG: FAD-dependent oxidoreductase [Candidatus Saccharimonadia bacterium]
MKFKLIENLEVAPGVWSFRFDPPHKLDWTPGQYIEYNLPHEHPDDRGITRWFTISSTPDEAYLQITTRIDAKRSSSFKLALLALKPGDTIEAGSPEGDFTYLSHDPAVFLAGGIGITPYRAIIAARHKLGASLPITLCYGARDNNFVFYDELENIRAHHPEMKINYIVADISFTREFLSTNLASWKDKMIYVSGPEVMVEALDDELKTLKVPERLRKSDYFPNYLSV